MSTPTAITGSQLIADGLLKINVIRVNQTPTALQLATGVRTLNEMMAEWELDGGALGYTPIGTATDVLTVPDGAIKAIKLHFAIASCSDYSATASPELVAEASKSMDVIDRLRAQDVQANLSELPLPANISGWPGRSILTG